MDLLGQTWDFLTTASNWSGPQGIAARGWAHIRISAFAVTIAAFVSIPPAVVLGHVRRGGTVAVSVVNLGRAVPSFGILALALPISIELGLGLGFWPTLVPLVILGIPPIFANAYTGVRAVDPGVVESAQGMGLRPSQVLRQVEMPIAAPLIITGLRISAVQIVATATLGFLVGFQSLGSFISEGIATFNDGMTLSGGLLIALLAVIVEVSFSLLERAVTPWRRAAKVTVRTALSGAADEGVVRQEAASAA
jgi:osmoprotectant transport system permease protein